MLLIVGIFSGRTKKVRSKGTASLEIACLTARVRIPFGALCLSQGMCLFAMSRKRHSIGTLQEWSDANIRSTVVHSARQAGAKRHRTPYWKELYSLIRAI